MKSNQVVTVSYDRAAENQWCVGATVGSVPCDCTGADTTAPACEIDSQAFLLTQANASDRDLMHSMGDSDSGSYSFDPVRGFAPGLTEDLTMELRSDGQDFRLNLLVSQTGRVTLCSDPSHPVPGYADCETVTVSDPDDGTGGRDEGGYSY
jgi:hypothetical protein